MILSTHYGKLSSVTTVFPPQEHIRIDIRYSESFQESQVLYPGLWILKPDPGFRVLGPGVPSPGSQILGSWVLGSWVQEFRGLGPHFRLCHFLMPSQINVHP